MSKATHRLKSKGQAMSVEAKKSKQGNSPAKKQKISDINRGKRKQASKATHQLKNREQVTSARAKKSK